MLNTEKVSRVAVTSLWLRTKQTAAITLLGTNRKLYLNTVLRNRFWLWCKRTSNSIYLQDSLVGCQVEYLLGEAVHIDGEDDDEDGVHDEGDQQGGECQHHQLLATGLQL